MALPADLSLLGQMHGPGVNLDPDMAGMPFVWWNFTSEAWLHRKVIPTWKLHFCLWDRSFHAYWHSGHLSSISVPIMKDGQENYVCVMRSLLPKAELAKAIAASLSLGA